MGTGNAQDLAAWDAFLAKYIGGSDDADPAADLRLWKKDKNSAWPRPDQHLAFKLFSEALDGSEVAQCVGLTSDSIRTNTWAVSEILVLFINLLRPYGQGMMLHRRARGHTMLTKGILTFDAAIHEVTHMALVGRLFKEGKLAALSLSAKRAASVVGLISYGLVSERLTVWAEEARLEQDGERTFHFLRHRLTFAPQTAAPLTAAGAGATTTTTNSSFSATSAACGTTWTACGS